MGAFGEGLEASEVGLCGMEQGRRLGRGEVGEGEGVEAVEIGGSLWVIGARRREVCRGGIGDVEVGC